MQVKNLTLKNYRNYKDVEFSFKDSVNVLVGKNGVGKTNVLEAIYVLTHGKSWRTKYDFELIKHDCTSANVVSSISDKNNPEKLFVGIERGMGNRSKKAFKSNEIHKSLNKFSQSLKTILFSPQDLEIILGTPSMRRRFLDEVLSQVSYGYKKDAGDLKKVVTQRNRVLKRLNEGLGTYEEIYYWNKKHIDLSSKISASRKELVGYINNFLDESYSEISNSKGSSANIDYVHSEASDLRFAKYKTAEVASKRTLIGAQKDDLKINYSKNGELFDARFYASRGEQRTLVFILKLAALKYIEEKINKRVVLLLDDIYSELDTVHRDSISTYFKNNQVILTTAEELLIPNSLLDSSKIIHLD